MPDGTIKRDGQRVSIRHERFVSHDVDRVWAAMTDPAEIERWTGSRPELDLRPGGEYVTHHRDGRRVVDHVLRADPPTLFEHTFWAEVNPSAVVTWQLRSVEHGCALVVTHTMTDDDIRTATGTVGLGAHPVAIISRNAAGWHRLLDRIECYLDERTDNWSREDQAGLQRRYATTLEAKSGRIDE